MNIEKLTNEIKKDLCGYNVYDLAYVWEYIHEEDALYDGPVDFYNVCIDCDGIKININGKRYIWFRDRFLNNELNFYSNSIEENAEFIDQLATKCGKVKTIAQEFIDSLVENIKTDLENIESIKSIKSIESADDIESEFENFYEKYCPLFDVLWLDKKNIYKLLEIKNEFQEENLNDMSEDTIDKVLKMFCEMENKGQL